jgi:hypothetical protein
MASGLIELIVYYCEQRITHMLEGMKKLSVLK